MRSRRTKKKNITESHLPTLEVLNSTIIKKFSLARSLGVDITDLGTQYNYIVAPILESYSVADGSCQAQLALITAINNHGLLVKLDDRVSQIAPTLKTQTNTKWKKYWNIKINEHGFIEYMVCDECNGQLELQPNAVDLVCNECARVITYTDMTQKADEPKTPSMYNYVKHCEKWIDKILAEFNKDIPSSAIDKVKALMERDYTTTYVDENGKLFQAKKNRSHITCKEVREWLKEAKLSKYYDHAALIRKIIAGIVPPKLSPVDKQDLLNSFVAAMTAYEQLNEREGVVRNKFYYPFALGEIIKMKYHPSDPRYGLLDCIHRQGPETEANNRQTWARMLAYLPRGV